MYKETVLIVFLTVLLAGCNRTSRSINQREESITELQGKVYNGDIEAYNDLKIILLDYSPDNTLFWAMIMANKYNYAPAYMDVYYALKYGYEIGGEGFREKDTLTREILIQYLTLAAVRGDSTANEPLRALLKQ